MKLCGSFISLEDGKLVYNMFLRTQGSEDFVHHLHGELEKQAELPL